MPISYGPTGYGALSLGLAQKAGEAIAARKAAEIAAELQMRREAQAAQMAMQQMQQQFEMQKFQISQQLDLEQFARAKSWETEKMEIASRLDFEQSEQKRQTKQSEFDTAMTSIDKAIASGKMTKGDQSHRTALSIAYSKLGAEELARKFAQPPTMEELKAGLLKPPTGAPTGAPTPTERPPVTAAPGQEGPRYSGIIDIGQGPQLMTMAGDLGGPLMDNVQYQVQLPDDRISDKPRTGRELKEMNPATGRPYYMDVIPVGEFKTPTQIMQIQVSRGQAPAVSPMAMLAEWGLEPLVGGQRILPPKWQIDQSYNQYLSKVGKTKDTLTYYQWVNLIREQGLSAAKQLIK